MATGALNGVVRRLRRAVQPLEAVRLSDGQLLEQYIARRDESAFAEMVRRHGPMVLGVCRRVLSHEQDAEDAFQATFLVLVRKAASVRPGGMVGNWLYGVACRTATKAKGLAARRKSKERAMAKPEAAPAASGNDLHTLLDRELEALPDKYRAPLVLCDLEGKTRREAAAALGWPPGTVAGRLARGRALLARRLARRGLSVGGIAAVLAPNAAAAPVPSALLASTLKAAGVFAGTGSAGVSTNVLALTQGVLKTMLLTKIKTVTGVLALVALAVVAVGGLAYPNAGAAQESQPPAKKAPAQPAAEADKAKKNAHLLHRDRFAFFNCMSCHQGGNVAPHARFRTEIAHAVVKFSEAHDRETVLDVLEEIESAVQALRKELRKRK